MYFLKKAFFLIFWNIYTISYVYLATIVQVCSFLLIIFFEDVLSLNESIAIPIISIFIILSALSFGYFIGTKKDIKNSFFFSFFPSFLILIPLLIAWIIAFYFAGNDKNSEFYIASFILSVNYPLFIFIAIFGQILILFFTVVTTYLSFIFGMYVAIRKKDIEFKNKKILKICMFLSVGLFILSLSLAYNNQDYMISDDVAREDVATERLDTYEYTPFKNNTKLTKLKTHPTLLFYEDHPRIDGATGLYPIYASMAQELYKNTDNINVHDTIKVSRTPYAYSNLIDGYVDIIFALEPSLTQIENAKDANVDLILTPIAKEAFVFFVNSNNPVDNLSTENIQDIYSGKIKNWSKLSGEKGKILAFQRPQNSGSQTTMENLVMKNKKMKKPLEEEYHKEMGGIINKVADYRNINEAIGYSFRFYSTNMHIRNNIKLLNIDNIAPTIENIQNGSYPFTTTIYIVNTKKTSENGKKLIEWFKTKQAQELIKDTGYVPYYDYK